MTKKFVPRLELAISLFRTLSGALDVRPRLVGSEILGSDPSLLLRLGSVDDGRLRPALIPIGSSRAGGPDGQRSLNVFFVSALSP